MAEKNKVKKKMGRPLKQIDKRIFEGLCRMQCTQEEIADAFDCDADTLTAWCKRTYFDSNGDGMNFSDVFRQKRGQGKVSLRRMQWKTAEAGNVTMQIFLGKNFLGQSDKQEIEHSGEINNPMSELTVEELRKLANEKD